MEKEISEKGEPTDVSTIEEAARALISGDTATAIEFLRKNMGDTGEFCRQVFDAYQDKDKKDVDPAGIYQLGILIENLLEK
jgi:hypothetical protein